MDTRKVDVAIVGAGTAGLTAYGAASKHTDNLVLIERGPWGTTCARVGCMPSKLLIAAADNAQAVRHSRIFGVESGEPVIRGEAVMQRVQRERDHFVNSVLASLEKLPTQHKIEGRARFVAPHRLAVNEAVEVEAKSIVIATGVRPKVPEFLHNAGERLLVNDTIFELADLPRSIAVFGPGVLGIEIGQALSRLGVDVRMFGVGGEVASISDSEIRDYADRCFNEEFYLDADADVQQLAQDDGGVAITYRHRTKGRITEHFDYVLAATGRAPNLDNLGLADSGLRLDDSGMPVTDPHTLQCGDSHIFLAGDANGRVPFLHEAAGEGRIAGANAACYPEVHRGKRDMPLSIVFTSPQIATVGLTLDKVPEREKDSYAVGEACFEHQGRSRVKAENRGILKVYAEHGSGLFVGAEIFAPDAEHLGHLLAWAAQSEMTVPAMLTMPFYHPVTEEGVRTALREINHQLDMGPRIADHCLECGPGD